MKAFEAHDGRAVDPDGKFKHVMALTLDPRAGFKKGLIRCITDRSGEIGVKGNTDRSVLHHASGEGLETFSIGEPLLIKGEKELIEKIGGESWDYIGLEDPDIWIDPEDGKMHVYFTIPLISKNRSKGHSLVSLGHAEGQDLHSLVMTEPAITADKHEYLNHKAKEVCIAPVNSEGVRINLVESGERLHDPFYPTSADGKTTSFSIVRTAIARDMGSPWEFGEIAFHPADHKIPWIAQHASPGPLLPRSFIDLGPGRMLGIMNGREADVLDADGRTVDYRIFSVGLFIYDYEHGKIEWVSPDFLIRDAEAKTITFASQFVETNPGEGILYAHVDDSFVRAYTLFADGIRELLP